MSRLNAILVVSRKPALLRTAAIWIRRLDQADTARTSGAGAKTRHLDGKARELIALAVAITLRCDGCIAVHTAAAKKHGATKEEIAEALGVGISVNGGAALVYSTRTLDAFDAAA